MRAIIVVSLMAMAAAPVGCMRTNPDVRVGGQTEQARPDLKYGFRYDPMRWVESDESLRGTIVRKLVLGKPKAGDQALLDGVIREVLAKQKKDGSFGGNARETGQRVKRLLELGYEADRAEIQKALDAIGRSMEKAKEGDEDNAVTAVPLPVLCLPGAAGRPEVKTRLIKAAEELPSLYGKGCPGTPYSQIASLWPGRDLPEVQAAVAEGLKWVRDHITPSVSSRELGLTAPWAVVRMVGKIDHPLAGQIAHRLVPFILRGQRHDGSWGDHTESVFRVLQTHGLLDELRGLPPLPSDWKVVRSIPAPGRRPFNLAFDGDRLWVHDHGSQAAFAVSTENGAVLKKIVLPGSMAFGAWDGSLWVLPGSPGQKQKSLVRVDAENGQVKQKIPLPFHVRHFAAMVKVGGRVLISDQMEGYVWSFDPANPADYKTVRLGAGMPDFIGSHGDDLWCIEGGGWGGVFLVRTNLAGEVLDWGEQPFGWGGVAWDGKQLWALDRENQRICLVEKSSLGEPHYDWLTEAAAAHVEPAYAFGEAFSSARVKFRFENRATLPAHLDAVIGLTNAAVKARPDKLSLELVGSGTNEVEISVSADPPIPVTSLPELTLKWTASYQPQGAKEHVSDGSLAVRFVHKLASDGKQLWAIDTKGARVGAVKDTKFLESLLPEGVTSGQVAPAWPRLMEALELPAIAVDGEAHAVTLTNTVSNPFAQPLEVHSAWDTANGSWSMDPESARVKIAPGGQATVRTAAKVDRYRVVPTPKRTSILILGGSAIARIEHSFPPPPARPHAVAARLKEPTTLDGVIGQGEYGAAVSVTGFRRFKGHDRPMQDTGFVLAYDSKALYLGIMAQEPKGLTGEPRDRDGAVYMDDDIEVFVDATGDRKTYHQLAVGLKHNVQFDSVGGPKYGAFGSSDWNGNWRSAVKFAENIVVLELAIPYTTLGVKPPGPGSKWGLNVCRQRKGADEREKSELSCWSAVQRSFHSPSQFGIVTFE